MRRRIADGIAFAAGAGLFGYVLVRAATVPVTFDEATTRLKFARAPWRRILFAGKGSSYLVANNHVINTLLTRVIAAVVPRSTFAIRLPNVAAFAMFAVFLWFVLRQLAPPVVALAGFVAIAGNPYMLEFFSLCRGYGLAIGFLVAGVFFGFEALSAPRGTVSFAVCVLFLSLATLSSYPLIAPLVVALAGIAAWRIVHDRSGVLDAAGNALPAALIGAAALVVAVSNLLALRKANLLYFGGDRGYYADTVTSLVELIVPSSASALVRVVVVLAWAAATLVMVVGAVDADTPGPDPDASRRGRLAARSAFIACAVLLDGSIAMPILAHALLRTKYPIARTATFFLPLFGLFIFGALGDLARRRRRPIRIVVMALAIAFALGVALDFAREANLRRTSEWYYDADTPAMLADLSRERAPARRIRLSVDWHLGSAADYAVRMDGLSWVDLVPKNPLSGDADWCWVTPRQWPAAARLGFHGVRTYPETGNVLGVRQPGRRQ